MTAVVLAITLGAAISGFVRNTEMPEQPTVTEMFDQTSQISDQPELASLVRADAWLNSPPLTSAALRGKVVLIDFWTYTCINWLRTGPYVRGWAEKYRDQGLVVIGVHAPEFGFEKNIDNVRWAVKQMQINYPVAVDNEHTIWRAFKNSYWPALYFIDARGRIRHHQQRVDAIVQIAADLEAMADQAPRRYERFEQLLSQLHDLGFFPTNELVSDVAHAAHGNELVEEMGR